MAGGEPRFGTTATYMRRSNHNRLYHVNQKLPSYMTSITENIRSFSSFTQNMVKVQVSHAGHEVAVHHRRNGRFERVVDPLHFDGIVGSGAKAHSEMGPVPDPIGPPELLRPLLEYERL